LNLKTTPLFEYNSVLDIDAAAMQNRDASYIMTAEGSKDH